MHHLSSPCHRTLRARPKIATPPTRGWAKSPFCVIPLRPCLLQGVVGCRDSPNSLHPLRALSFGLTKIWRGLSGFNKKKKSKRRKGGCKSQKAEGREKRKRWQKGVGGGTDSGAVASTKSIPFRQMGEGKQPKKKPKKTNCRRKTECGLHLTTDEGGYMDWYMQYIANDVRDI